MTGNVKTIASNHPHLSFQVFANVFYDFTLLSNTSFFCFFFAKVQSKSSLMHELIEKLLRAVYIASSRWERGQIS